MPGMEIDKQIDQLLGKSSEIDEPDVVTDSWKPAVPEYAFAERARIADVFFGPEAELSAGGEGSYSTNSGRPRPGRALSPARAVSSGKALQLEQCGQDRRHYYFEPRRGRLE